MTKIYRYIHKKFYSAQSEIPPNQLSVEIKILVRFLINNKEPRLHPCGTPDITLWDSEV